MSKPIRERRVIARYHLKNGQKSRRKQLRRIKREHPGKVIDLFNYKFWKNMNTSVRVSEFAAEGAYS